MTTNLSGRRIAFLVANEGVERVELEQPWDAVKAAGGTPVLVAPDTGDVQTFDHLDKAAVKKVDLSVSDAAADTFDALVLPGGVANPDQLRMKDEAVGFVRDLASAGKPIAVICHGPWTLVEAGVVEGRTLTSWPSLQTDIRNAGGSWVDEEVHVDREGPGVIVSSRKPDDLPAFCDTLVKEVAAA
ncbi:MAG TPA: type 1 glutamine amidotransferase domain-containing protein [Mycobacteriales bacterium]|nr:type 1 glutamine amidotransferase domain-containing protein [Mycobacteriales bacterium]